MTPGWTLYMQSNQQTNTHWNQSKGGRRRIHFPDIILSDRTDRYCFMTEYVSPRY